MLWSLRPAQAPGESRGRWGCLSAPGQGRLEAHLARLRRAPWSQVVGTALLLLFLIC